MSISLIEVYESLLKVYGLQGWWPHLDLLGVGSFTSSGKLDTYHSGDYSYPRTEKQAIEIFIGVILVQYVAWKNVEKSLVKLKESNCFNLDELDQTPLETLTQMIEASRFNKRKAVYLKALARFLKNNKISDLHIMRTNQLQEALRAIKGIGKESADQILVYVFRRPIFVVDKYTKYFLTRMNICRPGATDNEIKSLAFSNLPQNYEIYNEIHALIIEHCIQTCVKNRPKCSECVFNKICPKKIYQI